MKNYISIAGLLLVLTLTQSLMQAQDFKVENPTLQKMLESMAPQLHGSAISAIFVRTKYRPQTPHEFSENKEPEVCRTTISELLVNSGGIKESVCDARKTKLFTKEYAFHYSNNGTFAKVYDSRNNKGTIRKSPNRNLNYLSSILSPYIATRQGRFISRAMPVFMSKFESAQVTSETGGTIKGTHCIILEGKYENSDPERYFKITIIPAFNYAVARLEEYDKNKQILTEIDSIDFVQVPGGTMDLWLPKQTLIMKYTYDTYEGNSIQFVKLDILEPQTVATYQDMFSLEYSPITNVYDATADVKLGAEIDLDELERKVDELATFTIEKMQYETQVDKKGVAIIARAKKAYKRENALASINEQKISTNKTDIEKIQVNHISNRTLQMPQSELISNSNFEHPVSKILQSLLLIIIVVAVSYIIVKKFKSQAIEANKQMQERG